jgi:hypothetical protein
MTSEKDTIQKRIIDLELISDGYEELLVQILGDKDWRKNLRFIDDLEATIRTRQQALMDSLNALAVQRENKGSQGED